jgi:hypothetical protein
VLHVSWAKLAWLMRSNRPNSRRSLLRKRKLRNVFVRKVRKPKLLLPPLRKPLPKQQHLLKKEVEAGNR